MSISEGNNNLSELKDKAKKGVILLTIRNFGLQGISFLGFFLLSFYLGAKEIGTFGLVLEVIAIVGYFSDIGLASALIQKRGVVEKKELDTVFFVQQALVLTSLLLVNLLYGTLTKNKDLGQAEFYLFLSLCFSFFAASLKTIPAVLLERNINFKSLSTVDIAENIVFYIVAVVCAKQGLGVHSYTIATLVRSVVGLVLIYKISPYLPSLSFHRDALKELLKYGIPFQANSTIALLKDRFSNIIVAGIIGRESFGYLSWGQKAPRSVISLMDAVMRVTFPAFSRLQEDPQSIKKILEKSLYIIALITFPLLVILASIAPHLLHVVPKYTKWQPALVPLYLYCISFAIAAITTPITNALNATGKVTTTSKYMVMWTVLTFAFYIPLSHFYGFLGTAVASLLVNLSSYVVWLKAKKQFSVSVLSTLKPVLLGTTITGLSLFIYSYLPLSETIYLATKPILGIIIFTIYMYLKQKDQFSWAISQIFHGKKTN